MNGKKLIGIVLGVIGAGFVVLAVYPIASYMAQAKQKYPELISPLRDLNYFSSGDGKDYTKASNWFDDGLTEGDFSGEPLSYGISIPKLDIELANVIVGGEDLSKHLIHYPGTTLPGRLGNSVIFGHSILPIFFNPKNYLSIFSTLSKLDEGDEILVDFEGSEYRYRVEDMFEVKPTNLDILTQGRGTAYLTLVTCTPPGHPAKPKRLVVRARLVS